MNFVKHYFHKIKSLPKKISIPIILVLLIGGWFLYSSTNKKIVVETSTVKKANIKQTVSASGTLQGKDTVNLHFGSGGIIKYIRVKEGDVVSKSQVLAGLDTQDLSITLQQAKNTLRDKQAILDKVLDDVKNHSSDETLSQKQSRTTAEVAKDNAFDNVRDAERALREATLISPIAGIVTKVGAIPGSRVISTDLIAQVVDRSSVYFDAEVDEADINKIKLEQVADVILNSSGDKIYIGKVEKIIPVTTKTSSGSTVIAVRINLGNPDLTFVPGIEGQVTIVTSDVKNILSIPQDAIVTKNEVYVQENNVVRSRSIETGFTGDTEIEVKSGLEEGEVVVINPASVKPVAENSGIMSFVGRLFGVKRGSGGGSSGGTR